MAKHETSINAATVKVVAALLTDVAMQADVDLRTAVARARGDDVRGRAGVRVDRALAEKLNER